MSRENFNSIKVRLKPQTDKRTSVFIRFQFHKGTIKTEVDTFLHLIYGHFNSIKVRLKLIITRK